MREIGVGLLGTGFAGRAHAHAILEARRVGDVLPIPIAICSRSPQRAKTYAQRFLFKKYYTDWRALIGDEEVEVVINALPNYEHRDPNVAALEAGKSVLSEKPLGRSLEEAVEIAEKADSAGVTHGVSFNHRWLPAVQLMVKLVREGFVGKVRYFRAAFLEDWAYDPRMPFSWRFDEKLAGYGIIGDNGSHAIDLARVLVGEIVEVAAVSRIFVKERPHESGKARVATDDATAVLLTFENDAIGVIESSRVLPGRTNYLAVEVYGDKGAVAFNLERPDELWVADYREGESERGFKRVRVLERVHPSMKGFWEKHSLGWVSSFSIQLAEFLKAVAARTKFEPDFWDGAAVNAVLDAIKRSSTSKKWVEVERVD